MDFKFDDTMPTDCTNHVHDVLDFLTQTLTWCERGNEISLPVNAQNGLCLILLACCQTLKHAEQQDENAP